MHSKHHSIPKAIAPSNEKGENYKNEEPNVALCTVCTVVLHPSSSKVMRTAVACRGGKLRQIRRTSMACHTFCKASSAGFMMLSWADSLKLKWVTQYI